MRELVSILVLLQLTVLSLSTSVASANGCEASLSEYFVAETTGSLKAKYGLFETGALDLTLSDDSRGNRSIPISIVYPVVKDQQAQAQLPVIVFSHGTGLDKESHLFLGRYWASHGFVSIHATHSGSDSSLLRAGDDAETRRHNREVLTVASTDPQTTLIRKQDLHFILNSLNELAQGSGLFAVDWNRVGVAGYSMGANTALVLAAEEPRVKAVIGISPAANAFGLSPKDVPSWNVKLPMMTWSGSRDKLWPDTDSPVNRLEPFFLAPDGHKVHVLVLGATHYHFVGSERNKNDPLTHRTHDYLKAGTLMFWEKFLNGRNNAVELLEAIQRSVGHEIQILRK